MRADQFEAAMAWVVGIEGLIFELSNIQGKASAFRALAAVRDHVKELQAAVGPISG